MAARVVASAGTKTNNIGDLRSESKTIDAQVNRKTDKMAEDLNKYE